MMHFRIVDSSSQDYQVGYCSNLELEAIAGIAGTHRAGQCKPGLSEPGCLAVAVVLLLLRDLGERAVLLPPAAPPQAALSVRRHATDLQVSCH